MPESKNTSPTMVPAVAKARAKTLWERIRKGRTEADLIGWLRENMTGDQLIPQWDGHNYPVWLKTNGPIQAPGRTSPEDPEVKELREYLKKIYKEWLTREEEPQNPALAAPPHSPDHPSPKRPKRIVKRNEEDINKRIDELFAVNSQPLKNGDKEVTDYHTISKTGRYAELANDYIAHLLLSSLNLPVNRRQFYAVAIYSSARYKEMLAIARGNHYGDEKWNQGTIRDLWFLTYASNGIKELSKLPAYNGWITKLNKPPEVFESPAGNFGYLRRDLEFPDTEIEKLFHYPADLTRLEITGWKTTDQGWKMPQETGPPKTFTDKGMMSTTDKPEGVSPYNEKSNVVLFIRINKDNKGECGAIPMATISRLPLENEILWAPATRFRILAIRDTRPDNLEQSDAAGWRKGSRKWSKTEKVWVYMEATAADTIMKSNILSNASYSDALKQVARLDILPHLYPIRGMKYPPSGEIPSEEFFALLVKMFPEYDFQPGLQAPMSLANYSKELQKMKLRWLRLREKSFSGQYPDLSAGALTALALYTSPLWGWIKAGSGIADEKEASGSSIEKNRALYSWILQNILDIFTDQLTRPKPADSHMLNFPEIGRYQDYNATEENVAYLQSCKKPVILSQIGLLTSKTDEETTLNRESDWEGWKTAPKCRIVWTVTDTRLIPEEEKFYLYVNGNHALLIHPEAAFIIERIERMVEQPDQTIVFLKYLSRSSTS